VIEKYFHGANSNSRFLSNSVAKSFHSVLVGVALQEGKILSVPDPNDSWDEMIKVMDTISHKIHPQR